MADEDKPHDLMAARKAAMKVTLAAERADLKRLLEVIEKRAAEGEEPNIGRDIDTAIAGQPATDIPPHIAAYLDAVAGDLRAFNRGKPIPASWARYLLRKPAARSKRGPTLHPNAREITMSLLGARLRGRGNLICAMEEAADTYGVNTRTLERWISQPTSVLTGPFGEYEFALTCRILNEIRAAILEATGCDLTEVARLAELAPIEYDCVRQAEADAMGVPVTTLDAEVARFARSTRPLAAALDEPDHGRGRRLVDEGEIASRLPT